FQTGDELLVLRGHAGAIEGLAFSPDGRLLVSGSGDRTAKVWQVRPVRRGDISQPLLTLAHSWGSGSSVAFTAGGRDPVTAGSARGLRVGDAKTGQAKLSMQGHVSGAACIALSPDGRRLVSGGFDRTLKCWDLARVRHGAFVVEGHGRPVTA